MNICSFEGQVNLIQGGRFGVTEKERPISISEWAFFGWSYL
jgi:hypothetical protein